MSFIQFHRHTKVHCPVWTSSYLQCQRCRRCYKPISTDHSPAHSHPRTQCGKLVASPEDISDISDSRVSFQLLKTSPDGLTIKTRSVVPLSNFVRLKVQRNNKPWCRNLHRRLLEYIGHPTSTSRYPQKESWHRPKTYKSLQNNAPHPIPAHQPIKVRYHGVSSGQTTVLFVAS